MENIESVDIFKTRYQIKVQPFTGVDYSKKCFVLPGQGAMAPGRGRGLLERFEVVRKRFQKADQLAESSGVVKPSLFVTAPETIAAEDVSLARSLSLFTMNVGLFELLISQGERPALITAHSFGEYAAFVVSGILRFEEAFDILIDRERALGNSQGAMIAVSASAEQIRNANLGVDVFIANSNSPFQTVVAVSNQNLKSTLQLLKRVRLPAKWLDQVSQPFHSPLLAEAKNRFATMLDAKSLTLHAPQIPILSSVNGKLVAEALSVYEFRKLFVEQMTTPVHFVAQLQGCLENGVRHFVDLSLEATIAPWIADSLENEKYKLTKPSAFRVESAPVAKKQFRATHDSKLVGLLNKVISSVTGYSIAEISLSKNFQEDLGIDSIKKAQIVLNFLDSQGKMNGDLRDGVTMNRLRTVEDVLNWFSGSKKSGSIRPASFGVYQKVWKKEPFQNVFLTPPVAVSWARIEDIESDGLKPHWFNSDALVLDATANRLNFAKFLSWFRAQMDLFKEVKPTFTLALLTDTAPSAEVAGLQGFIMSVAKEIGCQSQYFQVENFRRDHDQQKVELELRSPSLQTVRFSGGERFKQVFELKESTEPGAVPNRVAAIGGASGATFEILRSWAQKGCRDITVMGRRPKDEVKKSLAELTQLGAKVEYLAGDSTRLEDLERFVKLSVRDGQVDLIIQAAGVECSALVSEQDEFVAEEQVKIKLETARHLRDLSARYRLQKVIAFSSTAGEFGNAGQSVYAYANMAMAREFELAREDSDRFSIVSWPAWDNVGMTAKESIAQQLKLTGLHLLSPERANVLFLSLLQNEGHSVCMDATFDLDRNLEMVRLKALQSLFPNASNLSFPLLLDHWTSKDLPGLRDHLIMDQSLVPVSLPLALFWHLAYLIKGQACRLENVEALSFMVLHRRDSPYLLDAELNENINLEIRSNQTHVRATANSSLASFSIPAYHETAQFAHVDMFKQSYSRFGSRLHLLENVRTTADDRAYAIVDLSKHSLIPNHESMNRQVVLLEALFHLSGAASEAKTGKVSVPLSFDRVIINSAIMVGQKFRLVVECRYPTEDILEADLYVYNENGDACIAITNERLRLFQDIVG